MQRKSEISFIFCLTIFLASAAGGENLLKEAELVKKAQPHYPGHRRTLDFNARNPLIGGTSTDVGLVELVFMIGKNGKPYEVSVTRSTSPIFEEEAVNTILRYEYRPAKIQNTVIDSKGTALVESEFWRETSFPGTMGAPEGFHSFYNKFTKELEKISPDEYRARRYIEKMANLSDQTYVSLSHLELARYKYARIFATHAKAIEALYGIMLFEGIVKHKRSVLEEDVADMVVVHLLKLLLENGRPAEVLALYTSYHEKISKLPKLYSAAIETTIKLQESNVVIERKLVLTSRGDVHLPLFKRVFTIDQVVGELSAIKLRCDTNFAEMQYQEGAQYALPEAWGKCDLQLIGEPGTTASVLQQ